MLKSAEYWIEKLGMSKHPEGGYYAETYRSDELIKKESLDSRYNSDRNVSTTIFFLLKQGEPSKFHRLKSDETWFFHTGGIILIHILDAKGVLKSKKMGINFDNGELLQVLIPHNNWFAAEIISGDYALVSCTVAPGFDFADFELVNQNELSNSFEKYTDLINRLT